MAATRVKKIRTRRGIREHAHLGCPLTRNKSPWCFRICTPSSDGTGECGRVAPHALLSSTQRAIIKHRERKERHAHHEALELRYLDVLSGGFPEHGIRVAEGEADIVVALTEDGATVPTVSASTMIKTMADAAALAVSSLIIDRRVMTVSFNASLTSAVPAGELVARGRFVGMSGKRYLGEAMLTDVEGTEIGRGDGVFAIGEEALLVSR